MQNILEGNKQQSLGGYIKLCGVARGSLEELLAIYPKDRAIGEIREIEAIWGNWGNLE